MPSPMKTYREQIGLTQVEMATRLGVQQPFYSLIERGLRLPSARLIGKIAEVTDNAVPVTAWFDHVQSRGNAADAAQGQEAQR